VESERKRNYDEETSEEELKEKKGTENSRRCGESVRLKRSAK
jgi:hypothetical protein